MTNDDRTKGGGKISVFGYQATSREVKWVFLRSKTSIWWCIDANLISYAEKMTKPWPKKSKYKIRTLVAKRPLLGWKKGGKGAARWCKSGGGGGVKRRWRCKKLRLGSKMCWLWGKMCWLWSKMWWWRSKMCWFNVKAKDEMRPKY